MAEPLYRQIADDLRGKIEAGELSRGMPLPTEAELQRSYQASRNTIRDAVKVLITYGLVETRPGQGTFVTRPIEPYVNIIGSGMDDEAAFLTDALSRLRTPQLSDARAEILEASGVVASELRIEQGAQVVARYHGRYIDGTPWSMQAAFYPISLVNHGAVELLQPMQLPQGTADYLRRTLGIAQASWTDKLAVRRPDDSEASFFDLPADGPVAVVDISQTGYDEAGTPIRFTVTTYPADRNRFQRTLGTVPAVSAL